MTINSSSKEQKKAKSAMKNDLSVTNLVDEKNEKRKMRIYVEVNNPKTKPEIQSNANPMIKDEMVPLIKSRRNPKYITKIIDISKIIFPENNISATEFWKTINKMAKKGYKR
jgi:hypothetical protein